MPVQKNVKLNNLKKYISDIGEKISILTTKEWSEISTPEMY